MQLIVYIADGCDDENEYENVTGPPGGAFMASDPSTSTGESDATTFNYPRRRASLFYPQARYLFSSEGEREFECSAYRVPFRCSDVSRHVLGVTRNASNAAPHLTSRERAICHDLYRTLCGT